MAFGCTDDDGDGGSGGSGGTGGSAGTAGETCNHTGVDNGVAVVGEILEQGELGSLDGLDEALAAAVCLDPLGPVDLKIALALNAEASCASATLNANGEDIGTVALNFVGGCLSGSLPDLLLAFPGPNGDITATINNTLLAVTADQTMGFDGILSGTAAGEAAVAIAEILNPDAAAVVPQTFDILESLADEPSTACDSLSLVLKAGGVADTGAGGAGGSGGAGGAAGSGGNAGSGGTGGGFTPPCDTPRPTPPQLEEACTAENTNLTNPSSCDVTGAEVVTHQLTLLVTERDVSVGFDLDNKVTSDRIENASCVQGGLSSADGGKCSITTTRSCTRDTDCSAAQ